MMISASIWISYDSVSNKSRPRGTSSCVTTLKWQQMQTRRKNEAATYVNKNPKKCKEPGRGVRVETLKLMYIGLLSVTRFSVAYNIPFVATYFLAYRYLHFSSVSSQLDIT